MTALTIAKETTDQLKELADDVLQKAKAQGATAAEVSISDEVGFSATVRLGEVDTIIHNRDKQVDLTVYFGHQTGSSSSTDLRAESIDEVVKAACTIAKYTDSDPCSGLADAKLMATHFPDCDVYHPWNINPEQAIDIAKDCEKQAMQADKRIKNSEGAWLETHLSASCYANSHHFNHAELSSYHSLGCSLIAKAGDEMQREGEYSCAIDHADLLSPQAVAVLAAEKTVSRLGSRRVKTQKAPVVFACDEACSIIHLLTSAISGSQLYRKSTFLLDSLGQQVFPDFMQIHENPLLKKRFASSAYDGDGVATSAKHFIKDGVVNSYILGNYSANRLQMQTTGNCGGVHNLRVDDTGHDLPALLQAMGKGLLVTELMGQGVNLVTGDYSRGAAGFWIENGEIQYPVHEVTIAANIKDMFANIVHVGNDANPRNGIQCGSMLIEQMMIAGE